MPEMISLDRIVPSVGRGRQTPEAAATAKGARQRLVGQAEGYQPDAAVFGAAGVV